MTDKEIILKIKKGEIDYFEIILKKYSFRIYNFFKLKGLQKEEIEDLTQNTFIKFYQAIGRFNENLSPLPYLYQIARSELKMFYRSKKPILPLKDWFLDEKDWFPDEIFFDKEECFKNLKKNEKEILLLLTKGYSYKEIAEKFKRPLNTIKTIIRRARLKINR